MRQRVLVAVIGAPLLILALAAAPAWATCIIMMLLSALGCFELLRAVAGDRRRPLLFLCCFAAITPPLLGMPINGAGAALLITICIGAVFLVAVLLYGGSRQLSLTSVLAGVFGSIVIPAALSSMLLLRKMDGGNMLVLLPLFCAFGSDTIALFAGMLFGGKKLAPHVSPNKTVSGFFGGLLGGVLFTAAFSVIAWFVVGLKLTIIEIILVGLSGSLIGQLGDLSFSYIKREFHIKDYGTLLPGHGGVLDRFDSVIFVAPIIFLWAEAVL